MTLMKTKVGPDRQGRPRQRNHGTSRSRVVSLAERSPPLREVLDGMLEQWR
jgi:hypothetical protein